MIQMEQRRRVGALGRNEHAFAAGVECSETRYIVTASRSARGSPQPSSLRAQEEGDDSHDSVDYDVTERPHLLKSEFGAA